jgi:hypothetical protein
MAGSSGLIVGSMPYPSREKRPWCAGKTTCSLDQQASLSPRGSPDPVTPEELIKRDRIIDRR